MNKNGTVYWVTGLSGAGKQLYYKIKSAHSNTLFLDGDELRKVLGIKSSFSPKERLSIAYKYSRLCKLIVNQNLNVVIATISMFHEIRDWNKKNLSKYREIYIKVPMEVLIQRDQKKIYSSAIKNQKKNVTGLDIKLEEPRKPDVLCINDGSKNIEQLSNDIFNELRLIDKRLEKL